MYFWQMSETLDEILEPKTFKLYTANHARLATFLGGPLAAGILARHNYMKFGETEKAKKAVIYGVIGMLAIVVLLLVIPTGIIEKIPSIVIPLMYTLVAVYFMEKAQQSFITKHTDSGGEVYSYGRSAGIGLLCSIPFTILVLGAFFLSPEGSSSLAYDRGLEEFSANEEEAFLIYDMFEVNSDEECASFIKETGLPNWQRNNDILNELDQLDGLDQEMIDQTAKLRTYSNHSTRCFELYYKALDEQTDAYDDQIMEYRSKVDASLEILNGN